MSIAYPPLMVLPGASRRTPAARESVCGKSVRRKSKEKQTYPIVIDRIYANARVAGRT